jgi:hypothetical protein
LSRDTRRLGSLPAWLWVALGAGLAAQIAVRSAAGPSLAAAAELPPAPSAQALRLASFGEPEALGRVAMLYLQAFELGPRLDYARLVAWLRAVLSLDPRNPYPLFAAARIYAETSDSAKARQMLEFVHEQYLLDPDRRWPWLAHAALLAKHRLGDLPLARRYAAAIDRHTTAQDIPLWARQMEVFILEDMNELDAARVVLGGLLESGRIQDPDEAAYLRRKLEELERRTHR